MWYHYILFSEDIQREITSNPWRALPIPERNVAIDEILEVARHHKANMVKLQKFTHAQRGQGNCAQEVVKRVGGPAVPRETERHDKDAFYATIAEVCAKF